MKTSLLTRSAAKRAAAKRGAGAPGRRPVERAGLVSQRRPRGGAEAARPARSGDRLRAEIARRREASRRRAAAEAAIGAAADRRTRRRLVRTDRIEAYLRDVAIAVGSALAPDAVNDALARRIEGDLAAALGRRLSLGHPGARAAAWRRFDQVLRAAVARETAIL